MRFYRTIVSIALALLVMLSSSSFMVGIHLCGGRVQNIALFTKAEACAMEKKMPPCHKPTSKPCCEDETILHQGEDFQSTVTDISFTTVPLLSMTLPPVLLSEIIPSALPSQYHFLNYDPPLRTADVVVSFQVFLI